LQQNTDDERKTSYNFKGGGSEKGKQQAFPKAQLVKKIQFKRG